MKTRLAITVIGAVAALITASVLLHAQMKMLTPREQVTALERSIARGKQLFNDPQLGTNGRTCNSCHPDGGTIGEVTVRGTQIPIPTLVGAAATFPKWKMRPNRVITLGDMANERIERVLQGKALTLSDQRYADLCAYMTSLSRGKPVYPQLGKKVDVMRSVAPRR